MRLKKPEDDEPEDEDYGVVEMDNAAYHMGTLREKKLPVDEINTYRLTIPVTLIITL